MEIVIKIAQLLLSLSILVVVHELGHFLFAKLFNTRVEKFYLFFDPWFSLFKFKKGDTEYGIGWLPLGGYVKIAGMIDESMDKEQMSQPPKPDEFRSKTSGQRLLIMIGGVLFNLILAGVIYTSVLKVWGEEYLPTENLKYGIVCDSLAMDMGFENGDKILSVDNVKIERFSNIVPDIILNESKTVQVNRNGTIHDINIPKEAVPQILKGAQLFAPRIPFTIAQFAKESAGEDAGLLVGDKVIGIGTAQTMYMDEFRAAIKTYKNTTVPVHVIRNGDTLAYDVAIPETALIGAISEYLNVFELETIEYTWVTAVPAGIKKSYTVGKDYLKQFKLLFNPETKAYESLGGFIAIGSIFPDTWDWQRFWGLTGFLSIMLGILNILPIPALDGGHVLFLLYEIITRRKPSDKFLEYAQMVGFVLLLALLLFANGNDIFKLFK
jgi:regulator of sigma E protease